MNGQGSGMRALLQLLYAGPFKHVYAISAVFLSMPMQRPLSSTHVLPIADADAEFYPNAKVARPKSLSTRYNLHNAFI
jgi:hypothetical protein